MFCEEGCQEEWGQSSWSPRYGECLVDFFVGRKPGPMVEGQSAAGFRTGVWFFSRMIIHMFSEALFGSEHLVADRAFGLSEIYNRF